MDHYFSMENLQTEYSLVQNTSAGCHSIQNMKARSKMKVKQKYSLKFKRL